MSSNSPRLLVHVLLLIAMAACAATDEATRADRTEPETIGVGAGRGTGAGTGAVESAEHAGHSGAERTITLDADPDLEAAPDADPDLGAAPDPAPHANLDADLDEEMEWLREARR